MSRRPAHCRLRGFASRCAAYEGLGANDARNGRPYREVPAEFELHYAAGWVDQREATLARVIAEYGKAIETGRARFAGGEA